MYELFITCIVSIFKTQSFLYLWINLFTFLSSSLFSSYSLFTLSSWSFKTSSYSVIQPTSSFFFLFFLLIFLFSFIVHLPSQTYSILLLFFKQSILKQLLTEGEKYVLSISPASMYDQGLYEIVNNLGSLFARFLFQPLEEGFYLYVKQVITVILWLLEFKSRWKEWKSFRCHSFTATMFVLCSYLSFFFHS